MLRRTLLTKRSRLAIAFASTERFSRSSEVQLIKITASMVGQVVFSTLGLLIFLLVLLTVCFVAEHLPLVKHCVQKRAKVKLPNLDLWHKHLDRGDFEDRS